MSLDGGQARVRADGQPQESRTQIISGLLRVPRPNAYLVLTGKFRAEPVRLAGSPAPAMKRQGATGAEAVDRRYLVAPLLWQCIRLDTISRTTAAFELPRGPCKPLLDSCTATPSPSRSSGCPAMSCGSKKAPSIRLCIASRS